MVMERLGVVRVVGAVEGFVEGHCKEGDISQAAMSNMNILNMSHTHQHQKAKRWWW